MKWSEETFRIFGINPLEGEPKIDTYNSMIYEGDRERVRTFFRESIQKTYPFEIYYRIIHRNGSIRHVHTISEVLRNQNDQPILMSGTMQDVTDQKEVEFKLAEQSALIQKITDLSPNLIYILDFKLKRFFFYNESSTKVLGFTPEEIQKIQNDFLQYMVSSYPSNSKKDQSDNIPKGLLHPDDLETVIAFLEQVIQSKEDKIFELDHRALHKTGRWVWLHKNAIPFSRDKDGKIDKILMVSNDISHLKKADSESRNAMLEGQEKERQRIATDLHDALNPLLSITKLNIESLKENINPNRKEEQIKLNNAIQMLQQSMKEIKEISGDLMPTLLKDFGLAQALQDHCLKISEGTNLIVDFDCHGLRQGFDKKTEIALFRISQELLNNIIKHANATEAEVQLIQHQNKLTLMIDDNGKGLDLPYHQLMNKGFGFRNVESRIKSLDGRIEVDTAQGRGTTITIKIPLVSNLFLDFPELEKIKER